MMAVPSTRYPVLVRLALLVRPWWPRMGQTLLASLLDQSVGIALPAVGALLTGYLASGGSAEGLPPYLAALAALAVVKGISGWLTGWFQHDVAVGILATLRANAYVFLEPLAPAYTIRRRSGDISSMVMSDVDQMQVFFSRTLAPSVVMLFVVSAVLIGLAVITPVLALVLVPFLLAVALLPLVGQRWGDRVATAIRLRQAEVSAHLVDSIQGMREVVAFGRGPARVAEVAANSGALGAAQQRNAYFTGTLAGTTDALVASGGLIVLLTAILQVANGGISRYLLPLVLMLAFQAFRVVTEVAEVAKNLNTVAAAARRFFEVVDEPVLVNDPAEPASAAVPAVAFDDVTFRYHPGDAAVLDGVSFSVQPGETVALVGPSGSGKSTCASLLLRFWDPEAGAIQIGGVNLRDLGLDDLRRTIAIVQQDNFLFNTTIRENLRLGRPEAIDDEIQQAAREANIHEFVESLPQGYDTIVGERGVKLSGGQRQRIAIARALVKNAPILILDEATSNLDTENERQIRDALARLMVGRTTIVIAHRLSTIAAADRVVMIDGGHVVASGAHTDLVAADGAYARLTAAQRRVVDGEVVALD